MPGRAGNEIAWGERALVVDTSAFARAHHADVRKPWQQALLVDRLRMSPATRLEILFSARDGASFDQLAQELSALRPAPLTSAVIRAAEGAMRALAHRSAGAQRIPIVDYLIAAAAQETGAGVIHYDRDYDTLAEVMEFESIWLAPAGTLP
jgi:predicted nucleic acid-binding protein